jgi:hypothetical protein
MSRWVLVDNYERIYIHKLYQINGRTQCFNQDCPGYVQVNSEIPLGWTFLNPDAEEHAVKLRINKVIKLCAYTRILYLFFYSVNSQWYLGNTWRTKFNKISLDIVLQ